MTIIVVISIVFLVLSDILAPLFIVRSNKTKFTKQSLQNEEEIQTVAKTHWIVMLNIIIVQLLITALCIIILTFGTTGLEGSGWIPYICVFAVITWLLARLKNQILYWCREFVVTNKRVMTKAGIFSRETREFRFEKIESCDVNQSVFGRLLGFGSIVVRGVGGSGSIENYINDPFGFRQYIIDRISNKDLSIEKEPQSQKYDSIAELQAYKKLLDDGVITNEDFEKKKQDILDRKS